ncbi:MAG: hypothetical protein ACRC5M_04725 [Anaeroplasmataceae bacterium]
MYGNNNTNANPLNESVTTLLEVVPEAVRSMTYLVFKYMKLVERKYQELLKSDERRRMRNNPKISSIFSLTLDKAIFALDRDMYIDFINEIEEINNNNFKKNQSFGIHRKSSSVYDSTCVYLEDINFSFLVNPDAGLNLLDRFRSYKRVPLIEVRPYLPISVEDQKNENEISHFTHDLTHNYSDRKIDSVDGVMQERRFGVGISIDICDMTYLISDYILHFGGELMKHPSSSGLDVGDFYYAEIMTDEMFEKVANMVVDHVGGTTTYSAITTMLAVNTKLIDYNNDVFGSLSESILNNCRRTMIDNFDVEGDNANTGMVMRHMSVEISTILNALAHTNNVTQIDSEYNAYDVLKETIMNLLTLKYMAYNYTMIPYDNLKIKKLVPIGKVALSSTHNLSADNRTKLKLIYTTVSSAALFDEYKKNRLTDSETLYNHQFNEFFVREEGLLANGTYPLNKRMYDCGKDLVDVFTRFIIIKKRMTDARGFNFSDGNIDRIGKTHTDYKNYMKNTYAEIKVALTNIYNRIKSITIGKRYLSANPNVKESTTEVIKNVNQVIFGVNTESKISVGRDSFVRRAPFASNSYDVSYANSTREDKHREQRYHFDSNKTLTDIISIYNVLKERECTYASKNNELGSIINEFGNGSLVSFWVAFTNSIKISMFNYPFEEVAPILGQIITDYSVNSITEMQNNSNNPHYIESKISDGIDVSRSKISDKNYTFFSTEDLRMAFEDLKEKVKEEGDESVVGGMLFSDFGGVSLANDITAKETEIYSKDVDNMHPIDVEDAKSFESLKQEFDDFLLDHI